MICLKKIINSNLRLKIAKVIYVGEILASIVYMCILVLFETNLMIIYICTSDSTIKTSFSVHNNLIQFVCVCFKFTKVIV